jgi:DNA-binding response OmpR family regulator
MAKKILIVDDDQDLVYMVKETLQRQGYEVITAGNGTEGLRLLKTHTADLMIVDLTMPGMGGWHFNMKVREDERYKKTPIIVLSGLLERDSEPESFETANAYMVKPFDIFKLMDKVKDLLQG